MHNMSNLIQMILQVPATLYCLITPGITDDWKLLEMYDQTMHSWNDKNSNLTTNWLKTLSEVMCTVTLAKSWFPASRHCHNDNLIVPSHVVCGLTEVLLWFTWECWMNLSGINYGCNLSLIHSFIHFLTLKTLSVCTRQAVH